MKTWFPSDKLRALVRPFLSLLLVGFLPLGMAAVAGCAAGESTPAPPANPAADVPFAVEVAEMYITVVNRSTGGLSDVRVTILGAGPLRFEASYSRLPPSGQHVFSINDFRSAQDNSLLNLRTVRPRAVLVKAKDENRGHEVQLQVPWKR